MKNMITFPTTLMQMAVKVTVRIQCVVKVLSAQDDRKTGRIGHANIEIRPARGRLSIIQPAIITTCGAGGIASCDVASHMLL